MKGGKKAVVIGLLTLDLFLPDAHSLKEKRSLTRPLLEKIRREWNVSVAETGHGDSWQRTILAVVSVNTAEPHIQRTFGEIARLAESGHAVQLLDFSIEII